MRTSVYFSGPDAATRAHQQATYARQETRQDWLIYRDRRGLLTAEALTAGSLKRALLAKGTTGRFKLVIAGGGGLMLGWKSGLNLFAQLKPRPNAIS